MKGAPRGTVSGAASALRPLSQGLVGSLRDAAPPWAKEGVSQGRGSGACLRLGGLGPPGSLVLQMAPHCLPDHRPVLPGASLPSLVWPACTTQRLGLPPSVSLRSLAGVPWPRAQLQPGNHWPPSVALCLNDEPIGEGRVRTSESTRSRPRPSWAEKLRHRETKGSPVAGLTESCGLPCRLSLLSLGALVHAVWVLEWAGAPRGSRGPILILPRSLPAQQTRDQGLVGGKKEGLGAAAHLPRGAEPLLVAVFDGPSDPHCTPLPGTQRGPTYVCTQCRGAAHGSPGLRLLRVWSWAEAPAKPCPAFWCGRGGLSQERGWGLPGPETRPRGDGPGKATVTAREVAADTASLCWYNSASHGSPTRRAVFPISQMRTWRPRQVE